MTPPGGRLRDLFVLVVPEERPRFEQGQYSIGFVECADRRHNASFGQFVATQHQDQFANGRARPQVRHPAGPRQLCPSILERGPNGRGLSNGNAFEFALDADRDAKCTRL